MDALVLGLRHEVQRHQNGVAEEDRARKSFGELIRHLIEERRVQVVAEEAGNDNEVAEDIQKGEDVWAKLVLEQPRRIEVFETIARTVTRALDSCNYIDIRPPRDGPDSSTPEYEEAMLTSILQNVCLADSLLVLCGEDHRQSISEALSRNGWSVETRCWNAAEPAQPS